MKQLRIVSDSVYSINCQKFQNNSLRQNVIATTGDRHTHIAGIVICRARKPPVATLKAEMQVVNQEVPRK